MKTNCPKCGTSDYYLGLVHHNCMNSRCNYYSSTSVSNIDGVQAQHSSEDAAPYRLNNIYRSSVRILIDEKGNDVLVMDQNYYVSKKYPTIVASNYARTWFACHYKNKGVGREPGAWPPYECGNNFTEAVEKYMQKWGTEEIE